MKFSQIKYFIDKFHDTRASGKIIKFTTRAAFFSVFIGSFALIMSLSILDGFEDMLTETTAKFTSDISIVSMNSEYVTLDSVDLSNSSIEGITEIIEKPVIVRKKNDIDGFILRGIDYNNDINDFSQNIEKGKFGFTSDSAKEVIISKKVAKKMGYSIGDNVIIYSIDATQQSVPKTKISKFKIVALYDTGLGEYDNSIIIAPLHTTHSFFDIEKGKATRIELSVKDKNNIDDVTNEIASKLNFPYMAKNVFDYQRMALIWIQVQKEPIPLVLGIITIVAVLNVVTMLLILIVEKTRQIGIMKVLGMSSKDIIKIFVFIGVRLSLKAALTGGIVAFVLSILQKQYGFISLDSSVYFLDTVPISINPWHYFIVIFNAVVISAIVVLIPSIVSSKIRPVKVLRFS
jgi:lipoprotein-releasing system permease protein